MTRTGDRAALARDSRRWVVKIGSGVLSGGSGGLDGATIRRLAADAAKAGERGRDILLVSSGAILAGRERLKLDSKPTLEIKQAAAAVGQSRLMRAWDDAFGRLGIIPAQVLLTRDDFFHRERYLKARNTLRALWKFRAVPIVNENDTVAVDEIRFGDNDELSALVASLVDADLLVLLTDQDGLFTDDPRSNPEARLIPEVRHLEKPARVGRAGPWGSGGMASKVRAAEIAGFAGIPTIVANGSRSDTLAKISEGKPVGTLFLPGASPMPKRQQWISFASRPKGQILVDSGAHSALTQKCRSLLPSGVQGVLKRFDAGDIVGLVSDGVEFARGVANFNSQDLERIKGLKTSEIPSVLGYRPADEVVHRDNMAVFKK